MLWVGLQCRKCHFPYQKRALPLDSHFQLSRPSLPFPKAPLVCDDGLLPIEVLGFTKVTEKIQGLVATSLTTCELDVWIVSVVTKG